MVTDYLVLRESLSAVWTNVSTKSESMLFLFGLDQLQISDQARRPAEFKHIIKRRKRN
jgi:hypothetical protein